MNDIDARCRAETQRAHRARAEDGHTISRLFCVEPLRLVSSVRGEYFHGQAARQSRDA